MTDRRVRLALAVAVVVLVLDQATKWLVAMSMQPYQTIPLLPFFALTYVRNTGAAFSLLGDAPAWLRLPLFVAVTIGALWLLVTTLRQTPADRRVIVAALGGIVGGAVGNLIDRLRFGEVVDFLHLHWRGWSWPMFNVADSAITVGVVVVLWASFRASAERADVPV